MKVAIVHPWFLMLGGGEKVLEAIASMYPQADLYAMISEPNLVPETMRGMRLETSFLNKLPGITKYYRDLMALYPTMIEKFDLSSYDLVISSVGTATVGVNVAQDATHVCYCHSPQRSWWDEYAKRQRSLSPLASYAFTAFASYLRMWEFSAAQRVDAFAANSKYVAQRVKKYFCRESEVIYPPVDTQRGYIADKHDSYYLWVGRLGERKAVDLLIGACNKLNRRLVIVGTGSEEKRLKAMAGPTIEFLGYVPDASIPSLYANCRAFLFAANEDFGIAPVEAQSYGRPVIAYGHGGSLETVRVNREGQSNTGLFFDEQSVESIVAAILRFEAREDCFVPTEIQAYAREFDTAIFVKKMYEFIDGMMESPAK